MYPEEIMLKRDRKNVRGAELVFPTVQFFGNYFKKLIVRAEKWK